MKLTSQFDNVKIHYKFNINIRLWSIDHQPNYIMFYNDRSSEVESRLRSRIKEIIFCDVLSDTIVNPEYGLFDGITSSACLESTSLDLPAYKQNVQKFYNLLKPGGLVAIFGFMEFQLYQVINPKWWMNVQIFRFKALFIVFSSCMSFLSSDCSFC